MLLMLHTQTGKTLLPFQGNAVKKTVFFWENFPYKHNTALGVLSMSDVLAHFCSVHCLASIPKASLGDILRCVQREERSQRAAEFID